jgi:hypothetical protein
MNIDAADPATWTDADRKVAAWVVGYLRRGNAGPGWYGEGSTRGSLLTHDQDQDRATAKASHLRGCATLRVTSFEGTDGQYGCDTGCEYWRLEGHVACDHDSQGADFSVGDFGDLEMLLEDLQPAES